MRKSSSRGFALESGHGRREVQVWTCRAPVRAKWSDGVTESLYQSGMVIRVPQ